ncbi:Glyoxalase/bleomycin resistance protein/dioxygenase [Xylanimonas cellulosilytica DSM 15894]|uniref:Glyoxalase/bleomycin resistance protein/dioxygenase n=1 Tax=Xylanimonas cellulosilytica (strain DSM 15894 / JCM 12276 / CECT 5975 / KCTC 9989 / LMG 20990 / NBRC 107835 / XIL07) TaxID=446471 RepID=D1BST9_XYLCX|nr:VOC family protein [Xylanimonas cellulosilytica]ACZ30781.1 Glyoxalase/bleomycin resistance protein/dioxygenase [Xylanimonas cellulosilytica DSM 15894]
MHINNTFLPHTDPDASLAFYRDVLGFEVRLDVGQGTMRWITVAPPGAETAVVLYPPAADPGVTQDEQRTIAEMMAKGTYATIVLSTPTLDEDFDRIAAAGAEVVQEPTDQPYGLRDAAVRDPAGNQVRLNQARLSEDPAGQGA